MKNSKLKNLRLGIGIPFVLIIALSIICSCDNELAPMNTGTSTPPDFTKESTFESYFPDSGGVGTQIILKGTNLGTDTNYLRVTVNNKKAKIVGITNDIIYAVVPARADTGLVRLYVGQGENVEEFASEKKFLYKFKRNVTTLFGKDQENGRIDGDYVEARVQRPWFLLVDKEDALFFIDEGRGQSQNGAMRKAKEGLVETLVQCSSGPFQSPTTLAFSPKEDTIYIANQSDNEVNTEANVLYATREAGFVNVKVLTYFKEAKTQSVVVHPHTGEVFFNSRTDGFIYRYTNKGETPYESLFKINNAKDTEMRMLFSTDGTTLYLVVRNRHCIYKVDYNEFTHQFGTPVLWAGLWGESGYANGIGAGAKFNNPGQPALDKDNNLYIPDKDNNCIRKITPLGEVSLYAGKPNEEGYKDGTPDKARFRHPEAAAFLKDNALYVTDRDNHCIRRIVVE